MTRRELAIRLMKADGASEETIDKTFQALAAWPDSIVFFDGEVGSGSVGEGEEEMVKRMFSADPFRKPNN